jgi:hypothetical protein
MPERRGTEGAGEEEPTDRPRGQRRRATARRQTTWRTAPPRWETTTTDVADGTTRNAVGNDDDCDRSRGSLIYRRRLSN